MKDAKRIGALVLGILVGVATVGNLFSSTDLSAIVCINIAVAVGWVWRDIAKEALR